MFNLTAVYDVYDWQLALTAAPPSSEIFVFTDAPAKDAYLKSTITALIESRKTVVGVTFYHPSSWKYQRKNRNQKKNQ